MRLRIVLLSLLSLILTSCLEEVDCCEYITYRFYNNCANDSVQYDIKFIYSNYNYSGVLPYPVGDSLYYADSTAEYYFGEGITDVTVISTPIKFLIRDSQTPDSAWGDTIMNVFYGRKLEQGDHEDIYLTLDDEE